MARSNRSEFKQASRIFNMLPSNFLLKNKEVFLAALRIIDCLSYHERKWLAKPFTSVAKYCRYIQYVYYFTIFLLSFSKDTATFLLGKILLTSRCKSSVLLLVTCCLKRKCAAILKNYLEPNKNKPRKKNSYRKLIDHVKNSNRNDTSQYAGLSNLSLLAQNKLVRQSLYKCNT